MINTSFRIRTDRVNKNGETRVLLVIYKGKDTKELSTGVAVKPIDWDESKMVLKSDPHWHHKNAIIRKKRDELQDHIYRNTSIASEASVERVVEDFKGTAEDDPILVSYLESYISRNPDNLKLVTLMTYTSCLTRLKEFDPKVRLSRVDQGFLGRFESFLKKTHSNSQNTVFGRLKVLRKILRVAKRERKMNHYPFEHYKIKTEKTKRAFLSYAELKSIIDLKKLAPSHELVKDIYLFCVFTGGLRFGDVCTLKKENVITREGNKYLELKMSKTNNPLSFKLRPESLKIITKYKDQGPKEYLFPILKVEIIPNSLKARRLISSRNAYFNKVLKVISKKAELTKHLTMHTARHSFATISLNLGIQTEVVGEIMGHKDLKTTQIYTKILDESKNKAIDAWDSLYKNPE